MEKVVLITGASSGIGLETAKLFQSKNWRVAATMRSPERSPELQRIADVECFRLDVTDPATVRKAIDDTLEKFGRIDAVVNNAGYAVFGAFEAAGAEDIRGQFDTNVFGLMNVCRAILPYFRDEKRGVIVNIASVGGRMTFPAMSLYHATKWAVEGFSESLQYELEPFNIRVKVIEPGPIKTSFYGRSKVETRGGDAAVYDNFVDNAVANMNKAAMDAPDGRVVAETIYSAVTDGTKRLRYGVNTKGILFARRFLPFSIFSRIIKTIILR